MIEVTEADRKAAKRVAFALFDEGFSTGSMAETFTQQAFATHRIEAAKAERDRCEKIARDYAAKAAQRGWVTSPESAATAAKHIATAIKESQP